MDIPPISLWFPSYVLEYAVVGAEVVFKDRRTLSVGGEWLGEVPKLAISRNLETQEYHLNHCNEDWESLCSVESRATIDEIRHLAEKHYQGITDHWTETEYSEADAAIVLERAKDEKRCSFCGRSAYDDEIKKLIVGANAKICNKCVDSFSQEQENEGS